LKSVYVCAEIKRVIIFIIIIIIIIIIPCQLSLYVSHLRSVSGGCLHGNQRMRHAMVTRAPFLTRIIIFVGIIMNVGNFFCYTLNF
jgi:hypothetical protein